MTSPAEVYASRPWLSLYAPGVPADADFAIQDGLSLFRAALARAPDGPAVIYFDRKLSYAELDRLSDALASALIERGFAPSDRLALYMQNMPQFLVAVLGAWKAGGTVVPINPMNCSRELTLQFDDSRPKALICLDSLYDEVIATLPPEAARPQIVFTTGAGDMQSRNDARVLPPPLEKVTRPGAADLLGVIGGAKGAAKPQTTPRPDDVAFIVYTSGTTGLPKGAMNTHSAIAGNAQVISLWNGLPEGAAIFGLAPLFHVTGLVGHIAYAWAMAAPLILCYRFEPSLVLDLLREHRPAYMLSAITAFIALIHHKQATRDHFASLKLVVSGGAPIPPSVVEEFREKTGHYIHNGYGMTETCAGVIAVPPGRTAPVDPVSGALAIGAPCCNVRVWIADENDHPAPIGEAGEIVVSGPSIVPGYWEKPAETVAAMRIDGFRTGDVAFMDEKGWFYLVDRKKDMIVASGFKVWPREVEDVLYAHPAVREAAVVGVPDAYRGETVKAVVCLKPDADVAASDLTAWCHDRLAAYKVPKQVEIVEELPKTSTGKILRRMLR